MPDLLRPPNVAAPPTKVDAPCNNGLGVGAVVEVRAVWLPGVFDKISDWKDSNWKGIKVC
jgi:hypothetical protein